MTEPRPYALEEIASQPDCWLTATDVLPDAADILPKPGDRVAVIGCGTSWFMAMAYASLREPIGWTDAFTASELPTGREYDTVMGISRSGTTTELVTAFESLPSSVRKVAILGVADTPIADAADEVVDLSFADERSVVQTRFATTTLALLRAHLGEDISQAVSDARDALADDLPARWVAAEQVSFLGRGWTAGLALEAALKTREAARGWSEAHQAMDYRHGPISIAEPGRLVWAFGGLPEGLADQIEATGAELVHHDVDPMADLVRAQRLAVAKAVAAGLDPDQPRHLTRSVILDGEQL